MRAMLHLVRPNRTYDPGSIALMTTASDQASRCLSARMNDNEDVKRALATAILRLVVDQGERATLCSLPTRPSMSWQALNGRHPNKVGVLPQVEIRNYCPPNNLSLDALSSAQRCQSASRGRQPSRGIASPRLISKEYSMANNKNPNQKQPGEKEEGTFHYNPGNMSGKTIGSKKDADRQQANAEKEQPKQDREKR